MSGFFHEMREFLHHQPVFSAHEHHRDDAFQRSLTLDSILSNSYAAWLRIPWGQTRESRTRFLEQVEDNTFFSWLERSLRHIYGFDAPLTADLWEWLSGQIRASHERDEWFHHTLLRDWCRIESAVLDAYWDPGSDNGHPEIYRPAYRVNMFVMGHHPGVNDHNGNNPWSALGRDWGHMDEIVEWLDAKIGGLRGEGRVAVKSALAYDRDLAFGDPPRHEALRMFQKASSQVTEDDAQVYGDYIFNRICESCARHDVPFQIHLGLAKIEGSSPMHFEPTIRRHPKTRFVLLHAGYPWTHQVAGLARTYDNVYPDMTWMPLISTHASIEFLHELLETTRSCEHIGWGGDTWTMEESYAATLAWKHVIASVLSHRVDCSLMRRERAFDLAEKLVNRNVRRIYGLDVG